MRKYGVVASEDGEKGRGKERYRGRRIQGREERGEGEVRATMGKEKEERW